jgi:hypothetical protein
MDIFFVVLPPLHLLAMLDDSPIRVVVALLPLVQRIQVIRVV